MKKIVVFAASSSSTSINKKLAEHAALQLEGVELVQLDLNDFEMPIFSVDKEKELGIPTEAKKFKAYLASADGLIISFAEHNGTFSSAFKNVFDWASRMERSMWLDIPMLAMATSPGGRGGKSVLDHVVNDFPHRGGNVVASFSLPFFAKNYSEAEGILDIELRETFGKAIEQFKKNLI